MQQFNQIIKRYGVPAMWVSGGMILLAMLLRRLGYAAVASGIYLAAFVLAGFPVVIRAYMALRFKTVSIELLVTIAAVGSCLIGEFHESAVVTFLFQLGSFLEQKTMKKTRSAIKTLTELAPTTAWRMQGETLEEIDAEDVEAEDRLLVKSGSQIAADGIVVSGEGYAREAAITGESLPRHKVPGDTLYAGTILESGTLEMQATKVGEDTTFSKIIALVEEAQDAKSPAERFIDRFAKYYTPAVIAIAAAVLLFTRNPDTAITVLVLACPGALVIGAPIANVAGIGRGAQEGILLKGGDSIHTFAKTDTIVFDKTGTLTVGAPAVTAEFAYCPDPEAALTLAAGVEQASDHPLARALVQRANRPLPYADNVQTLQGRGMEGTVQGRNVLLGSRKLLEESGVPIPPQAEQNLAALQAQGASVVLVAVDGSLQLLLGISDRLKPDAVQSIQRLRAMGVENLIMLTGDNAPTAAAVAAQLGLTCYEAELLPQDKAARIRALREQGHTVTFVGDGINDSPALATADTGIAMGSGTDVAIDNSDVVLIKSDLESLANALYLSRKTAKILSENIAIAVGTVFLLLIGLFAGFVHMSIGMLIHEASILIVIFNAMRLCKFRKEKKS